MKKSRKEIFIYLILHPAVIALPFALITILLLPTSFKKAELLPVKSYLADKPGKQTIQYYYDLDNDNIDEEISHFVNDIGQCAIKLRQADRTYMGQWNFNGILPAGSKNLLMYDLSGDGILDVFTIFQRQDSLFFGAVNPKVDSAKLLPEIFIDRVKVVNGTTNFITQLYHHDLNNDGKDEILINLLAGFSEQPRRIYAYDFAGNTFVISPMVGFKNTHIRFFDFDGDGIAELMPSTVSCENIEATLGIPYHDYDRWFVIYDHTLNFKFGPKNMGPGNGSLQNYIFKNDTSFIVLIVDINNDAPDKYHFYVFDWELKKLQKITPNLDQKTRQHFFEVSRNSKEYFASYHPDNGNLKLLEPMNNFEIADHLTLDTELSFIDGKDINGDGKDEYIFSKEIEGKQFLCIYSNSFQNVYRYAIPHQFSEIKNVTTRVRPDNKTYLVLQLDEKLIEFTYKTDPFYLLKTILLNLLIYGFYVVLIGIITHFQKKILRVSFVRDQQLAELKLKSIRNQLDPHFTFNAINAVASAIMKEDKETAYSYFSMFSQLMRSTMLYSDQMTRILDEELKFTRQYLDIEKFRFREKFVYDFQVDPEVNTRMEVPRMIIQTFAESAVSNGLMHRASDGVLQITLKIFQNRLIVLFSDNGVGIEKSKRLNKTKAFKALRIMEEFIRIFNDLNRTDITYKIYDLNESEEFPGTEVMVSLPLIFKYRQDAQR
ncbi:MAG: histidine kinase [Bacteroidales bacterium]|nr:histidine kinase [Bacteroidales bacterium]